MSSSSEDDSEECEDYKLVVVARRDLGMTAGKLAVQVGHAVEDAIGACTTQAMVAWQADGSRIVVLQVDDERGLKALEAAAKRQKLLLSTVVDEGLTEVEDGVSTALAVGPDLAERVDAVTGKLRLYRSHEEEEIEDLRRRLREAEDKLAAVRRAQAGQSGHAIGPTEESWVLRGGESWLLLDLQKHAESARAQAVIPELFEQWGWEGDLSILPAKWAQLLEECCEGQAPVQALRPWEAPGFDRDGLFFLTHRSDTCGIALAVAAQEREGVVALGVHPSFRRRGLGRCLLRLALARHASLGRTRVFCAVDARASPGAWHLLTSEGFQPSSVGPSVKPAV